jgi:hypothetical protein
MEQESIVSGSGESLKSFSRFCPEILYERFGFFVTVLIPFPDEQDKNDTHRKITDFGSIYAKDWRWEWLYMKELHYSECSIFSLLPYLSHLKNDMDTNEDLVELKPSIGGFSLNIKVLLTRCAKWWLKNQRK